VLAAGADAFLRVRRCAGRIPRRLLFAREKIGTKLVHPPRFVEKQVGRIAARSGLTRARMACCFSRKEIEKGLADFGLDGPWFGGWDVLSAIRKSFHQAAVSFRLTKKPTVFAVHRPPTDTSAAWGLRSLITVGAFLFTICTLVPAPNHEGFLGKKLEDAMASAKSMAPKAKDRKIDERFGRP